MAIHFVSRSWEVVDAKNGIMVSVSQRDLDPKTLSVVMADLLELARESGQDYLVLDFGQVHFLPGAFLGRLIALDQELVRAGCRLRICNVIGFVYEHFAGAGL